MEGYNEGYKVILIFYNTVDEFFTDFELYDIIDRYERWSKTKDYLDLEQIIILNSDGKTVYKHNYRTSDYSEKYCYPATKKATLKYPIEIYNWSELGDIKESLRELDKSLHKWYGRNHWLFPKGSVMLELEDGTIVSN